MKRGSHVTIYLDDATLREVDRLVASKATTWRSRSRFINDACDATLATMRKRQSPLDPVMVERKRSKA